MSTGCQAGKAHGCFLRTPLRLLPGSTHHPAAHPRPLQQRRVLPPPLPPDRPGRPRRYPAGYWEGSQEERVLQRRRRAGQLPPAGRGGARTHPEHVFIVLVHGHSHLGRLTGCRRLCIQRCATVPCSSQRGMRARWGGSGSGGGGDTQNQLVASEGSSPCAPAQLRLAMPAARQPAAGGGGASGTLSSHLRRGSPAAASCPPV